MLRPGAVSHQDCTFLCGGYQMVHPDSSLADPDLSEEGSHTSVASLLEDVLGCKWSVRLIGIIASDATRPSELLRACPGLSAKVMNERLRKLVRYDIVRRDVFGQKPPVEVVYSLTSFGQRFTSLLDEVQRLQDDLATDRI